MNKKIATIAITGILLAAAPAPAFAAGCIAGAVVGGTAAHLAHHSVILGAIGGCIVGKIVSHPSSSITYSEVTGKLLGADADLPKVAAASKVDIIKVSSLKGFKKNDTQTQAAIAASPAVQKLGTEIAADPKLTATLQTAGFAPTDVIAVSAALIGGDTLFVNK